MASVEMMACPYCGAQNSRRKAICYQCNARMLAAASPSAVSRPQSVPRTSSPAVSGEVSSQTAPDASSSPRRRAFKPLLSISLRQRAQMYRQLHSLLRSGIPLGLALHHSSESCALQLRPLLRRLSEHVMHGALLSDKLTEFSAVFPEWEVNVIRAAEKSGALPDAMTDIAVTIEMEWDLKSRTMSSTLHLQFTLATAVLVVLIVAAVGKVQTGVTSDVFSAVGKAFIYFGLILLGVLGLIIAWRYFVRTRPGAAIAARLVPRVPLIGPILQGLGRIRFVRTLAALWKAGVSPLESLEIAAKTTGNLHFIRQIQQADSSLMKGTTISTVLAPTGYLPGETMYMLQTGETTGSVAESLEKVAEYFDMDLQAKVKTLPTKLMLLTFAIIVPAVFYILLKFWTKYYSGMLDF